MDLDQMTTTALRGEPITRDQALQILASGDDQLMDVVAAAAKVRRKYFGNRVKLNYLVNLKSGKCAEDCGYCSQRLGSQADILKYSWLPHEEVERAVATGIAGGASRICVVASGRGPSNREVDRVGSYIEAIKADHPGIEVCACLGFLTDEQAHELVARGADAYNHNLNTAESHYPQVTTTHTYADRAETVHRAQDAGLSACSGLIAGLGETDEQLVDVAIALRELGADSIPVNFLMDIDGTPYAGRADLNPRRCLRILAMVRLLCPDREVRAAAGRELRLRTLQPLALHIVNSIFVGDYLTTEGQAGADDLAMIADGGFVIQGRDGQGHPVPGHDGPGQAQATTACHKVPTPGRGDPEIVLRHRGAGTSLPANA